MGNSESTMMAKITITLTRYNEPDWLVWHTLESLAKQKSIQAEILFLDQVADADLKDRLPLLNNDSIFFKRLEIPAKSLSFARNYAIKYSRTDCLLFIDCDAIADENWAFQLFKTLCMRDSAIVGGKILPKWHKRPLAIIAAKIVKEQYSVLDIGDGEMRFTKVVGANFGINKELLRDQAYFDENLGRQRGKLLGGEETDLCDRACRSGLWIYYNGKAIVHHQILPERIRYSWILKRIFYAGVGRALKKGLLQPTHKMGKRDCMVLPFILPSYAAGYLYGKFVSITMNYSEKR